MKRMCMLFIFLFAASFSASAAITCKRELFNSNNLVFYENSKKIARFVWVCGNDYKKEGAEINGSVKEFDSIHGPIYDKTYTMLEYKKNRVVNGKYTEYYLSVKGSTKSGGNKAAAAGTFRIKNGEMDGEYKYYYRSGKILSHGKYKNGSLAGKAKRYYETGVLYSEETYSKGDADGEIKFYRNSGKLEKICRLKDCRKAGAEYFDINGNKLNYPLRTAAAAAFPAIIALFSLYLSVLAIIRLFSRNKHSVEIITEGGSEKALIVPDKKRNKGWIFLSLLFSMPVWLALVAFTVLNVHNFASGQALILNWTNLPFVLFGVFVNVLFAWSFLMSLDGNEIVEIREGVMIITGTWAGFKRHKKIPVFEIVKINPVIIEKESGEQYYGTAEVQKKDSPEAYVSYMSISMNNDELVTFAKYVGKPETEKIMEFLKGKIPTI